MFRCLDVIRRPVPSARAAAKTCYRRRKKRCSRRPRDGHHIEGRGREMAMMDGPGSRAAILASAAI